MWEVAFVNAQGAEHVINWELAASAEYRQMMSRYGLIGKYLQPPFVVESKAQEKAAAAKEAEEELSETPRPNWKRRKRRSPRRAALADASDRSRWKRTRRANCSTTC